MLLDLLRKRGSARSFRDRPVAPEILTRLLDAVRYAPSAFNSQPWRFVLLESTDLLTDVLSDGNDWVLQAPAVIVVYREAQSSSFNIGLAVQNLLLAATEQGISAHIVGGFDADVLEERLATDPGWTPQCLVALGYPDQREQRNRERKPLDEIAFSGSMDKPWPLSVREVPDKVLTFPIIIRFRDLDAMGHVNNATYFTFLEEARIAFRDALRDTPDNPMDFDVVVVENHLAYQRSILYGEPMVIHCWVSHIRDKSYRFHYKIENKETGESKATGYTVMVGFDYQSGQVQPLSQEFRERVRPYSV